MKLTVPLINEINKSLDTSEPVAYRIRNFFSWHKGVFGYHASQLVRKHHIAYKSAVLAAAFLSGRSEGLEAKTDLDPKMKKRLQLCVFSFSYLSKFETTCRLKICPICRADTVLRVNELLGRLPASRLDCQEAPVSQTLPRLTRRPGALLSVRNVIKKDNGLLLRQLSLFPSPGAPKLCKDEVLSLLRYDFSLLNDKPLLDLWLDVTKGMKFFSQSQT